MCRSVTHIAYIRYPLVCLKLKEITLLILAGARHIFPLTYITNGKWRSRKWMVGWQIKGRMKQHWTMQHTAKCAEKGSIITCLIIKTWCKDIEDGEGKTQRERINCYFHTVHWSITEDEQCKYRAPREWSSWTAWLKTYVIDYKVRERIAVKVLHTSLLNTTMVAFKVLPLESYAMMPAPSPPFKQF